MPVLEELEGLISSKWGIFTSLLSLIKLEVKLAGLSIYPLLLNLFMLFIILITVWCAAMLMFGYWIMQAYNSGFIAISAVLLLNTVLLVILLKYLMFNLRSMSFEKTRLYLSRQKEGNDNDLKKTGDFGDSRDGKKIAVPSEQCD